MAVADPVVLRGRAPEASGAIFAGANVEQAVGVLQVVAAHVTLWQVLEVTKAAENESKNTAALLELLCKCDSSRNLQEACITLVNELREFLDCGQITVVRGQEPTQRDSDIAAFNATWWRCTSRPGCSRGRPG